MNVILIIAVCSLITASSIIYFVIYTKSAKLEQSISSSFEERWAKEGTLKKQILEKFRNHLLKLCDDESIYVELFNDVYHLNGVSVKHVDSEIILSKNEKPFSKENLTIGNYIYLNKPYDTPELRVKRQCPKIKLSKDGDYTWVLAHELGHHFMIQYQNNNTEEAADHYIKNLAEQCLTSQEQEMLKIEINVYSGNC